MVLLDGICVEPLGMESQRIPSSQITSSSTRLEMNKDYSPTQARLRNTKYLQAGVQYQGENSCLLLLLAYFNTLFQ